jgi:outer membrane protein assembly factor BamA
MKTITAHQSFKKASSLATLLSAFTLALHPQVLAAQMEPDLPVAEKTETLAIETSAAPEFVSEQRRMSDEALAKKREGFFVTGMPYFSSDPLNGFGFGGTGYLFFNGQKSDPLFAYAPYQARLGLSLQQSTGNSQEYKAKFDMPYILNTPWRLRLDAAYSNSPNNLYFGLTEATLNPLPEGSYSAYAKTLGTIRAGQNPGEAAEVADVLKHRFLEKEWMINLKGERVLFDGNWRLLLGYEWQHMTYQTFENTPVEALEPGTETKRSVPNGQSLLQQDAAKGQVYGLAGGIISLIQTALIYDTRDFEPDPSKGFVAELGNEFSAPIIGSTYFFDKILLQFKHYLQLWPEVLPRTVLASRLGYGTILGDQAPFFEYQDQWSPDGSVKALGGSQTLRGFKANRLLGRTVAFGSVEVRHRLGELNFWGQNLSFSAVPFVDLGAIGDQPFLVNLMGMRASAGLGLRIGWNLSTIITMDYAFSNEDQQFFLNFNNSF